MPFLLETTPAFLNSGALPNLCLFSGRRDALSTQSLRLPAGVTITVPVASGEYLAWRLARLRWLWPIALASVAALAVFTFAPPELNGMPRPLLIAALLSGGVLFSGLYAPRSRRDCIRIRVVPARDGGNTVQILFPTPREHVFWEYQKAHKAFAAANAPPAPGL